ncbi:hypothetical protein FOA52_008052 [Chlamydomonas sp. UWO 241]|nr:hypothetical protein FOA52_008052 [Chlamydomonas sp. UWO 241]
MPLHAMAPADTSRSSDGDEEQQRLLQEAEDASVSSNAAVAAAAAPSSAQPSADLDVEMGEASPLLEQGRQASSSSPPAPPAPKSGTSASSSGTSTPEGSVRITIPSSASSSDDGRDAEEQKGGVASCKGVMTPSPPLQPQDSKGTSLCRICLEEDALEELEVPCSCAGTQRHAHHACIQRWVDEKGNIKCEICGQQYKGQYTVPPPPPPPPAPVLNSQMFIVDPNNPTRMIPTNTHQMSAQMARMQQVLDEQDELARSPAMNCVFTSCVFVFFLVVLHHSTVVSDGSDQDGPHPHHHNTTPPPPYNPWPEGDPDSLGDTILFITLFILGKALLIALPLFIIMKIAQKQAERQQYEEMMRTAYAPQASNRHIVIRVARAPAAAAAAQPAPGTRLTGVSHAQG